MFHILNNRLGHYLLLLATASTLFLPGLGASTLWDIDEGNNAECAREMFDADNWIVPTFNYKLRTDKPAMLYWLQMLAYRQFGVNEFGARLPSALASILSVLLTYEMGRRLFNSRTGLLGGLLLASAPAFSAAAHFANPDALLNLFTLLTLWIFWQGYVRGSRSWFALAGISTGLAMLTKGPVGLLLPGAIIALFLAWSGHLKRLLDPRIFVGLLLFVLVMGPWYGWVSNDTRWEFLRGFFLKHNLDRFRAPMEGHSGTYVYYLLVVMAGLLLWTCFLGPALWFACREAIGGQALQSPPDKRKTWIKRWSMRFRNVAPSYRFLVCWIAVYMVFFSLSRTKLPNYVLPVYPAVALVLGRFLDRWRTGDVLVPRWAMGTSLSLMALIGVLVSLGLLLANGGLGGEDLLRGRSFNGLGKWAFLGVIPVLGAITTAWCISKQRHGPAVASLMGTAVLFTGLLAVGPVSVVDSRKAPEVLASVIRERHTDPEIRIATYQYFQPSLVFYCGREVVQFSSEQQVADLLSGPLPAYLFVPSPVWDSLQAKVTEKASVLGTHRDLYRNCDVVLISNR
jgi:4-amino-4-deoxy-L-arabinose transferase-like glycosyltransferase